MPSTSVRHACQVSAPLKCLLDQNPFCSTFQCQFSCACVPARYGDHVQALQTGFGMLDPGDQDSAKIEQDILST